MKLLFLPSFHISPLPSLFLIIEWPTSIFFNTIVMTEFQSCLFAEVNQNLSNTSCGSDPAIVTSRVGAVLRQTNTG